MKLATFLLILLAFIPLSAMLTSCAGFIETPVVVGEPGVIIEETPIIIEEPVFTDGWWVYHGQRYHNRADIHIDVHGPRHVGPPPHPGGHGEMPHPSRGGGHGFNPPAPHHSSPPAMHHSAPSRPMGGGGRHR